MLDLFFKLGRWLFPVHRYPLTLRDLYTYIDSLEGCVGARVYDQDIRSVVRLSPKLVSLDIIGESYYET